jgi:hypothetical protein
MISVENAGQVLGPHEAEQVTLDAECATAEAFGEEVAEPLEIAWGERLQHQRQGMERKASDPAVMECGDCSSHGMPRGRSSPI